MCPPLHMKLEASLNLTPALQNETQTTDSPSPGPSLVPQPCSGLHLHFASLDHDFTLFSVLHLVLSWPPPQRLQTPACSACPLPKASLSFLPVTKPPPSFLAYDSCLRPQDIATPMRCNTTHEPWLYPPRIDSLGSLVSAHDEWHNSFLPISKTCSTRLATPIMPGAALPSS